MERQDLMLTQTDIAKHWGVSRQYVYKKVREGCPINSFEAADNWRTVNAQRRERVVPPSKQVKGEKPKVKAKAGKKTSKKPEVQPRGRIAGQGDSAPGLDIPRAPYTPKPTGDNLLDAVNSAKYALDRISVLLDAAVKDKHLKTPVGPLLAHHARALSNLFKTEKSYREELEKRKMLINKDEAYEVFRRGFQFMLKGLRELPKSCSVEANPQNPDMALKAVERHVDLLHSRTQERYAA